MSGSGIRWAICKSAPCSIQITMPAPHHSVFYRLHALPAAQPTVFKAHMNGKVSVVLNQNCFLKMKDFKNMPPTSNHVLRKVIVSKKWCKINTLLLHTANRKYCMADQFVISTDLEGHLPVAELIKCNLTNICATFRTV